MNTRRFLLAVPLIVLAIATACGGGGSGSNTYTPPPPPPPTPPTITTTNLPEAISRKAWAGGQLQATGGTQPYTWSSSNPISGLTVASDGKVTGIPQVEATSDATMPVTVRDSQGLSSTSTIHMVVLPPMSVSLSGSSYGRSGSYYAVAIFALPGNQNLKSTITLKSGTVPPGMTWKSPSTFTDPNHSIEISGTPTQTGIFPITVEATSSGTNPETVEETLNIFIDIQPINWYDSEAVPFARRTMQYDYSFNYIQGGTRPFTFSMTPGSNPLPAGISLTTDGRLTGIATTTGHYEFSVRLTDSGGQYQQYADHHFTMEVVEPIKFTASLPQAITGESYNAPPITITGGVPPYTNMGVSFSTCCFTYELHDGSVHGVPYTAGKTTLYVGVHDSMWQSAEASFDIDVAPGPFRQAPDILPDVDQRFTYDSWLRMISGVAPFTWRITSGAIPPGIGISYDSAAHLYGNPATPGAYNFTMEVQDSSIPPQVVTIPLSMNVYPAFPRNDAIPSATKYQIVPWSMVSSISPYADPPSIANPDQDYIHVRAFAGETLVFDVQRWSDSVVDPSIEVVNGNGQKFTTCRNPEDDDPTLGDKTDATPYAFDDVCVNDDIETGVNVNSMLWLRVPGASGTVVDVYLHIVDFRGDARPDMQYIWGIHKPMAID